MNKRKFLALALALVMVLGLVPTLALATSASSRPPVSVSGGGGSSVAVNQDPIVLVMAAEWTGSSSATPEGALWAKLLFMDGTMQIVPVTKLNGLRIVTQSSSDPGSEIIGGDADAMRDWTGPEGTAIRLLCDTKMSAFYTYYQTYGKYELTQVVAAEDGATEDDWAETATISNAYIEKRADFANGKAGGYTADSKTVFLVAKGTSDDKTLYSYTGFINVPEMKSANGLAVGTCESAVAKYVFLDTEYYEGDVPDGYFFVINNKWVNDPNNEDCYLINVVDADGNVTTLSVREDIKNLVNADNTKTFANGYISTNYVGKFCTVDEIDENGVVRELTPVTSFRPIVALGNGVVNDLYYDNVTKFVYVDMVMNDGDNADSAGDDFLEFSGAGTFNPNGFYDPKDVDWEHIPGIDVSSSATGSFASVLMDTLSADGEVADYVYVLRVLWREVPTPPSPSPVAKSMFTVDTSDETYTGKAITKTITGKDGSKDLVEGVDYTVAYQGNTNAGTATITITGMGDYTGTLTYTFAIKSSPSPSPSGSGGGSSSLRRPGGGSSASNPVESPEPTEPEPSVEPSASPVPTVTPASQLFSDVHKGWWYEVGITFVVDKGLFQGMAEGVFSPDTNMNRAMVMTVLARMEGQDTTNATDGPWYANIVNWAKAKGISDGTMPEDSVRREELVTMLYRYAKPAATAGDLTAYADAASVSDWAVDPMTWAVKTGILTGKDGKLLDPQGFATRAEVATIIQRFVEKTGK